MYGIETWAQTCQRVVEASMKLYSGPYTENLQKEAELMFDMMFHLESLPAGRAMRVSGTPAVEKYEEASFNCAYLEIKEIEDFCELFHLSLCSCGVGFKITKELVDQLPTLNTKFSVSHREYATLYPYTKREYTTIEVVQPGWNVLHIGDSKDGWVEALRQFFKLTQDEYSTLTIDYNYIRPEGSKLQTWGGRAAGPEGLKNMFLKLEQIIKKSTGILKPIDCLDICTVIGKNVVVGGTRRAAEIALFSPDDQDCIEAKFGDKLGWYGYKATGEKLPQDYDWSKFKEDKYEGIVDWIPNPEFDHRTMSNNSMVLEETPTLEFLTKVIQTIRFNGEPGVFNLKAAKKRRPNASGGNPCNEICLSDSGMCNLSTVPWTSHLFTNEEGETHINFNSLEKAYRLAVRIGMRQTNVTLSLPEWDKVQKRDRLLGVSITGEMAAIDRLGWIPQRVKHKKLLEWIRSVVDDEVDKYSYEMRIPKPLLATAVKPEGSLTLLTDAGSCGVHRAYAPFYIRRLKYAEFEPTCQALKELGVPYEKDKSKKDSNRWVFEFPINSGATMAADDESVEDQIERYLIHQRIYTQHNTSITVYVGEDEWEKIPALLLNNWDDIVGMSFLPKGYKGTQSPYEAISLEECNKRLTNFPDLSRLAERIAEIEGESHEEYEILDEGCSTGYCPVV